jgi:hypothetical protein
MNRNFLALLTAASAAALVPPAAVAQRPPGKRETVLRLASDYAESYGGRLALVLATERYEQMVVADSRAGAIGGGSQKGKTRVLVSDVIWAPSDQEVALLFYRDVYSVDGKAVRDRSDRLLPLFASGPIERGWQKARQVVNESARFNLGAAHWNVNFPTLALSILHPRTRDRFRFRVGGETTLQGKRAAEIEFREQARPTLARSAAGTDYFASGSSWVALEDGAVLKTELRYETLPGRIRVSYRYEPKLSAFVPDAMTEVFGGKNTLQMIEGTATYTEYRRGEAEVGPILYKK